MGKPHPNQTTLTIVSHNIEGLQSNKEYMTAMTIDFKPDFICLQETWLYEFQQQIATTFLEEYEAHSKSVDQDDPSPVPVLSRGYRGVTTMWNGKLHQPDPLLDGSNRIVVIRKEELVIINVYMPCRGSYTNMNFQEALDQLHEVCQKYSEQSIVVAGDFNVDPTKQKDTRVNFLKVFLAVNSLQEVKTLDSPTFKHHNGKHSSNIDFVFINANFRENALYAEYKVLQDLPLNTSSHEPILLRVTLRGTKPKSLHEKVSVPKPHGRPIWSKCDQGLYETKLMEYLKTDVPPTCPALANDYLMRALKAVTEEVVPLRKPKPRKKPWNPNLTKLKAECKEADAAWKQQNKPLPPHESFIRRKKCKKSFRSAVRIQTAISRQNNLSKLHSASENDSALFYSLVRRQRKSQTVSTKELMVGLFITFLTILL
jgi:exonuclease III